MNLLSHSGSAEKLRRLFLALAIVLIASVTRAQAPPPADADVERKVESLLNQMTIEEKVDLLGGTNFLT